MRKLISVFVTGLLISCSGGGGSGGSSSPPPQSTVNSAPSVAMANVDLTAQIGTAFSYDASQSGMTFSDAEGDTLSYSITLSVPANGLSASNSTISGTPTAAGIVSVSITATDPSGLSATDEFDISISGASSGKKNIMLIIADDMGQDSLAPYALSSDLPDTPRLNQLATNGVVFENLWVNPACSPTRAALISGRYGLRTGVVEVGGTLNAAETLIHEQLANESATADYESALIGKWHLAGGSTGPNLAGVDHFAGILSGGVQDYFDWPLNVNGTTNQVTTYATTEITDQAISWVSQQTDPWFMWVAYNAPHTPFHIPPSNLHNRTLDSSSTDRELYLAAIEAMDAEIGRLLDSLDPTARDNTVVMFIGDNGTPNQVSDNAAIRGAKGSLYEGGMRVPMIVSGAGVTRLGEREDAIINGADFFATIAELAGQTLDSVNDSKSFLPLLTDSTAAGRDYIYTELATARAIRSPRYKLIVNANGSEEFYDLESDPLESNNLIGGTVPIDTELQMLRTALNTILAGGVP